MSNIYGISAQDERDIRERDKSCVYCRILMKQRPHAMCASGATIEHFDNDGPFEQRFNAAICCRRCNSSKGATTLLAWFQSPYCRENGISRKTVLKPVREYMRLNKLS